MSSEPPRHDEQEEEEEEELLKLEEEVETMAQRILEYRTTLPDQLSSTLSSILASQRPVLPMHLVDQGPETDTLTLPEAGPTKGLVGSAESETMPLAITGEPEELKKIQVLKEKITSNASTVPVVLKRMKEFMVKIDKLETSNVVIHPAFKRTRTS